MADNPQYLNRYFIVTSDINATSLNRPIGREGGSVTNFTGTFDGNGHAITIDINTPSQNNVGLFATIGAGGIVRNTEVRGSVNGAQNVGGIAGMILSTGAITNSSSFVAVNGIENVGGIVGSNNSGGNVTFSFATGDVIGTSSVGGIAGANSGAIQNSYATGNVEGNNRVGGVAGENSGAIQFVYAMGRVTATNNHVGGIVGMMSGGTLSNSVALGGNVDGNNQIGRVVGNTGGSMNFNHGRENMFVDGAPVSSASDSSGHGMDLSIATLLPLWWSFLGWQSAHWGFTGMGVPYLLNVPNASAQNPAIPPVATMFSFSFSAFGGTMTPPPVTVPGGAGSAPGLLPGDDEPYLKPEDTPDMILPKEDEEETEGDDEEETEDDDEEESEDDDSEDESEDDESDAQEPPDNGEPGDDTGGEEPGEGDDGDDTEEESPAPPAESPAEEPPIAEPPTEEQEPPAPGFEDFMEGLNNDLFNDSEEDQIASIRDILWNKST